MGKKYGVGYSKPPDEKKFLKKLDKDIERLRDYQKLYIGLQIKERRKKQKSIFGYNKPKKGGW